MKSNLELNMPIYLDTNLLLDLLASIDDGFSAAKKITTDKVESQNSYNRGNIGFSAYLFDFGIYFGACDWKFCRHCIDLLYGYGWQR